MKLSALPLLMFLAITGPETILPVISVILSVLLAIFWKKLSSYKTQIVGVITVILGYIAMFDEATITWIAGLINIEVGKLQGAIIIIVGVANILLRKFQDPVVAGKLRDIPLAFGNAMTGKPNPNPSVSK